MIIDCHGHYTTAPQAHTVWRQEQKEAYAAGRTPPPDPVISDDEIRASIQGSQLKLMTERGIDVTIFSPRASAMEHHVGDQAVSARWAQVSNDLIARVQFLVDGVAVGPPLVAAPYSMTWDSTGLNASVPHTIAARATDVVGRTSTSGLVNVQVDNGPQISGVVVGRGLAVSSVHVTWTTDLPADGQVEYGSTTAYGLSTPIDPRVGRAHEAEVTGLAPATTYHYRVKSRDANGATAVSADGTFFTP